MAHVFATPEQIAVIRERLKKKLAERQAAKAAFASMCARIASEPRSSFGNFRISFEDVVPEIERTDRERRYLQSESSQKVLAKLWPWMVD